MRCEKIQRGGLRTACLADFFIPILWKKYDPNSPVHFEIY